MWTSWFCCSSVKFKFCSKNPTKSSKVESLGIYKGTFPKIKEFFRFAIVSHDSVLLENSSFSLKILMRHFLTNMTLLVSLILPHNPESHLWVIGAIAWRNHICLLLDLTILFFLLGNLLLDHWKCAGLSIEGALFILHMPVFCLNLNLQNNPVLFIPIFTWPRNCKTLSILLCFLQVTVASPNEDELIAMANALSGANVFPPIERGNDYLTESLFQKLKPAIWLLLEKGIRIVVVTLGSDGVFLCSKGGSSFMRTCLDRVKPYGSCGQFYKIVTSSCPPHWYGATDLERNPHLFAVHFPALPASVVRLTGAGDCLVGGMLASICAGLNVMQGVGVGIAAAKAAVEAETNVPTTFSLDTIADDARSVYSAAKVVFNQSML
ncbi:pseudouridine kinase [Fagus crenata]